MSDTLRIVIQVFDNNTIQKIHNDAHVVVLTENQQRLIAHTTDTTNLAQWAAEQLGSIVSCLEDLEHA